MEGVYFDLGATLPLGTTEFAEFTETADEEVKFSDFSGIILLSGSNLPHS
ncbi:MAG: hypothetical protein BroJett011_34660 [Chloroflexota bacterium]|nr:MAG: hypothetical protein BroJett011_34660 [Chloroflexota bacterium]